MSERDLKNKAEAFSKVLGEIPEIRYAGDPILKMRCLPAGLEEGVKIGTKLGETLINYRKITGIGRGLAAPQIGISKSVFVTYLDDQVDIFINPEIVEISETLNYYKEICLSITGMIYADIARPDSIEMKWTTPRGKLVKNKFDSFKARLYQHEVKHLNGVLSIDECGSEHMGVADFDPLKEQLRTSRS